MVYRYIHRSKHSFLSIFPCHLMFRHWNLLDSVIPAILRPVIVFVLSEVVAASTFSIGLSVGNILTAIAALIASAVPFLKNPFFIVFLHFFADCPFSDGNLMLVPGFIGRFLLCTILLLAIFKYILSLYKYQVLYCNIFYFRTNAHKANAFHTKNIHFCIFTCYPI